MPPDGQGSGRGGQGAIIFYGTAAMGVAAVFEQARFASAKDEYDRRRTLYADASGPEEIRSAYAAMESQYGKVQDRRDLRNGFLWAGGAIWALGIVNALMHPAEASPVSVSAAPADGGTVSFALTRKF